MAVTYTTALERDDRRARTDARRLDTSHLLLPLASLLAILAIGLAYSGRTRVSHLWGAPQPRAAVVNLNVVASATELEPPIATIFPKLSERRIAANALFQHVLSVRAAGKTLPNVGAIAAARAEGVSANGRPVLTADDVARLKPLLAVRTHEAFRRATLTYGALYLAAFYIVLLLWRLRGIRGDGVLLAAAHLLTALGFAVVLTRPDPLRDTMLFVRYTEGVLLGLGVMVLVSLVDFRKAAFLKASYLPLLAALCLSVILIAFGTGPGSSTAKVNLGPVQPIEAIRLLLALFLSGYFARRWELLRQIDSTTIRQYQMPAWLKLPRADYVLPVLAGVGSALVFFFLQKDLGPALFLSCVFLAMYAVARARVAMPLAGLLLLAAGFYAGYRFNVSATLADRVRMWQSPWDNAVRGGDQVAQSIWALATGGLFGTGLGFGDTRYVPAGSTDLVLAAVGEELGAVGLLAVAVLYAIIAWRGFRIALGATHDYGFFLATTVTLFLIVPVLVMTAGMLGATPLTGVVTPFLSYGGSAMVANFAALGMLMSIQTQPDAAESARPFVVPMRYLGGALAVAAIGLLALIVDVQVLHADDYVVKPHLSLQGDGVRRYQYNQRVLDIARAIPRGTIYDRRGVPLATSDGALVAKWRDTYARLGIAPSESCADELIERCYPLGGGAFHLIGDAATRLNWSATNTSYVERDEEDRLRGFEDHATTVSSSDASGRPALTVRRDYRDLIPLLRHRHDPEEPVVKRFFARSRDVRLSIDARLQARVVAILAGVAETEGGRAAAVVLDAHTGALLAAANYPWPGLHPQLATPQADTDALLDRARYGLYPPGSTFKLVTAIAALRRDPAWRNRTFTCSLLPDGRVGARVPGWTRPVRDDVLDRHPHGTIGMHAGMAHSCNAYFGQLALRLGPEPMLDTAQRLGISVAPFNSLERLRDTLPQAGYGQGAVLATPLRMARVAAIIASGGLLRDVQMEAHAKPGAQAEVLLPRASADLLARYMRDVVLSGTGRSLHAHPWRIAGKTGTAEVTGAPSHAWFVGFAPYGAPKKRIAFAVIIENAGYGGRAAARVAGDIVTAAAAAGLIE